MTFDKAGSGFVVVGALVAGLLLSSCGKAESYGRRITAATTEKIGAILAKRDDYAGRSVAVKGKIVSECSTGCWFDVQDEGGNVVHVDLMPSGLAIPQRVGREALVEGQVEIRADKPVVIGEGVEVR